MLILKKSSWESYLIFIRVDNPLPIWQKHCSLSKKTIRKSLERKMSRVDSLITQVSLCYHFTYFCALTIWSIFILEKHNFIYLYKVHSSVYICTILLGKLVCIKEHMRSKSLLFWHFICAKKKPLSISTTTHTPLSMQGKDLKPLQKLSSYGHTQWIPRHGSEFLSEWQCHWLTCIIT